MKIKSKQSIVLGFMFYLLCTLCYAERIKDLTVIQGIRSNPLIGYGLVVGLDGTGDSEEFTKQSFKNMLNGLGVTIPLSVKPKIKNVAAVSLHAELPAFIKPGQRIDVTVSSIGNASSLRGGSLLLAPLKGADGMVYAVAQGDMIVGGFSAEGSDGSKITVNVPVVGRIPNGAVIERSVPNPFAGLREIVLNLNQSDFTTAKRVAEAINNHLHKTIAFPLDSTSIQVCAPFDLTEKISLISTIENLRVSPGETKARIVANSRTGTIVIGKHVTVGPAAVAHGNLVVTVTETTHVSQPEALSRGKTKVTKDSNVAASQANNRMFDIEKEVSLNAIVDAVNKVGAAPGDLMAILEALKQAGALNADLEII